MTVNKDYALKGIHCANCARKIEAGVQGLDGVVAASLNFSLLKLSLEIHENKPIHELEDQIQKVMDKIEKGSRLIVEESDEQRDAESEAREHHGHSHDEEHDGLTPGRIILYAAGIISYFVGFFIIKNPLVKSILFIVTYAIFGHSVVLKSIKNIARGQIFDENFLMTIASIGAFIIGEFPEGAAVMMFYQIGEMFQDYAVDHSRKSIKSLLAIKPEFANLKTHTGFERVNPAAVKKGDLIVIRPGERVPLDGVVIEGSSILDTSALTGESLPREVTVNSEILSGSINQSGLLLVRVTKAFRESAVNRILSLVENAAQKKAVKERFITRFAAWYTPAVVAFAALMAIVPPLLFKGNLSQWVYRALIFLVLSCPCALVISIPLGFFGGIGAASKRGVLVKGGNYLEALAKAETVIFDKTGTLTKGKFEVTEARGYGITEQELIRTIAHAEVYSTHPLGLSVIEAYGKAPDKTIVLEYREFPGLGVSAQLSGKKVICGNSKLMKNLGIEVPHEAGGGTKIHLAVDGIYRGFVKLEDTLKADAAKGIKSLHRLGVKQVVMLTGDNKETARDIAERLGIDEVHAELLPHEKVDRLETIMAAKQGKGTVVFVGDGINDAPVIARADVGVAMGGAGSDAAIEAADIVMMTDEPGKLADAVLIARRTNHVVLQNIFLAVGVKLLVLALGAGGVATMWEAVFADVGVALLAILNAMRLTRNANQ